MSRIFKEDGTLLMDPTEIRAKVEGFYKKLLGFKG